MLSQRPEPPTNHSNRLISWSKNGFVAYAHPNHANGTNLSVSNLQSVKSSAWHLARADHFKPTPDDVKHLEWSPSGADLCVVDRSGSLAVLSTGYIKSNKQHQVSTFQDVDLVYSDTVGAAGHNRLLAQHSTSQVVAVKWLNVDKPIISNSPAVRNSADDGYTYTVHQYRSFGAMHPIGGKGAFLAVRCNSVLELHYQDGAEYRKISAPLDAEYVTLANVGFMRDGTIVVVTYSPISQRLKSFTVVIDWGISSNQGSTSTAQGSASNKISPVLKVARLLSEPCVKILDDTPLVLKRIDILSQNFSLDTELEILLSFQKDADSVIYKYEISGFKEKEGLLSYNIISELHLSDEICSIVFKDFEFLVVVIFNTGRVEVFKRKHLAPAGNSKTTISSLFDANFEFQRHKQCRYLAVSPNLAGYVYLDTDYQLHYDLVAERREPATDQAVVSAAFGYKYSSACFTNTSSEDLIILIQNELIKLTDFTKRENFIKLVLKESHKALNFSLDHSKDQIDRLLVNPPIQKLLSLQYSLGKFLKKNDSSLIALSILNLRLVSFSIMLSLRTLFHNQQRINKKGSESLTDSIYRCESILSILGTINWFIEFLVFIVQDLIRQVNNYDKSGDSIVLSILLSKIPRSLIIYSINGIKKIDSFLNKISEVSNNKLQLPYLSLELLNKSIERFHYLKNLIELDKVEVFLKSIDQLLAAEYDNMKSKSISIQVEQDLIFSNTIPINYKNLLPQMLNSFNENFLQTSKNNLSALYLHDTTWLGFQTADNEIPLKILLTTQPKLVLPKILIDDVTKTIIINRNKLKKCTRCDYITGYDQNEGILMANFGLGGNITHWPVAFHRTCVCGSCWVYI